MRVLTRNFGGGGTLMEELLARAVIPKEKICSGIQVNDLENLTSVIKEIRLEQLSKYHIYFAYNSEDNKRFTKIIRGMMDIPIHQNISISRLMSNFNSLAFLSLMD